MSNKLMIPQITEISSVIDYYLPQRKAKKLEKLQKKSHFSQLYLPLWKI